MRYKKKWRTLRKSSKHSQLTQSKSRLLNEIKMNFLLSFFFFFFQCQKEKLEIKRECIWREMAVVANGSQNVIRELCLFNSFNVHKVTHIYGYVMEIEKLYNLINNCWKTISLPWQMDIRIYGYCNWRISMGFTWHCRFMFYN